MVWGGENCIFGRVPEGCGVERTTEAWRPPHSHELLAGAGGAPLLGRCFQVRSVMPLGHCLVGTALQADSC